MGTNSSRAASSHLNAHVYYEAEKEDEARKSEQKAAKLKAVIIKLLIERKLRLKNLKNLRRKKENLQMS